MARTVPVAAEQPLDATRTAAGQVVTFAGAEVVAVQVAASMTLAALLWPLIPAARAAAGLASALGQWPPLRPLPEQEASVSAQAAVVMPGSGGAGRGATVPGSAPGAVPGDGVITLGVEEEFVLLDPCTGAAVLAAPDLVRMLDGEPGVRPELMRFQVETATGVCTSLDEVGRELVRLRRLAADAAARLGCLLVASGTAPYRTPGLAAVTGQPRYRELARRYGPVAAQAGTCACHVHVGVPSRDLGIQVLARVRPWLAPLLAITVNSPIAGGHDTGWASWRYAIQSRWPTAVPPAVWPDAAAYDAEVRRLIARGAALDERSVYFLARLSPRYPTVEVRVADVGLDAGTAVLLAGLTRALVATALAEARRGTPVPAAPARQVAAALAAAARHGLAGAGADPFTGQAVDAAALRTRLLDHVRPALSDHGDIETITGLPRRRRRPRAAHTGSSDPDDRERHRPDGIGDAEHVARVPCDSWVVIARHRLHLTPRSAPGQAGRPAAMASGPAAGTRSFQQDCPVKGMVMRCGRSRPSPRLWLQCKTAPASLKDTEQENRKN